MRKLLSLFILLLNLNVFAQVSVGEDAIDFSLQNELAGITNLSDYKGKLIVLEWTNHGCPFVKKHYKSGNMQKLQEKFSKDVVWLSVISSAKGKQGYSTIEKAKNDKKQKKSKAKYVLLDKSGEVGQKYGAKTTPHMFVIGKDFKIKYMGAIDSIASANESDIKEAKNYIDEALTALKNGDKVINAKTRPYGCSVKY